MQSVGTIVMWGHLIFITLKQINAFYYAQIVTEKYTEALRSYPEETRVRKRGELSGNPTGKTGAISSQALEVIPLKVQRLSR